MPPTNDTPVQEKDGIALIEERIDELSENLGKLSEEQSKAAATEVRDDLAKQIDEIGKQVKGLTQAAEDAKAALVPGVELYDPEKPNKEGFSFARACQAMAKAYKANRDGGSAQRVWDQKEFGYERDYFGEMREREAKGLVKSFSGSSDSAGGFLIDQELMSGIIEFLRAQSVAITAGARTMFGLTSNVAWVRNNGGVTAYWIDTEGEESITESENKFDQLNSRPHPLAALSKATWGMLNQPAISIEQHLRQEFGTILALAEDKAFFTGTGTNGQPLGLVNTGGISTNPLGTSADTEFGLSAAPSATTARAAQQYFRQFVQTLRSNNALGLPGSRTAYVTEPEVAEDIEGVVEGDTGKSLFLTDQDAIASTLFRQPLLTSTNMTQAAGGSASDRQMVFGDFNQALIPHWGATEFRVGEEGDDFKKARLSFRMITALDVVVLQPTAFVKATTYAD